MVTPTHEVQKALDKAKKELKKATSKFKKTKNHDDLETVTLITVQIDTLSWVVGLLEATIGY